MGWHCPKAVPGPKVPVLRPSSKGRRLIHRKYRNLHR
ncbi:uncharacterized protein PGTG_16515 [Puccinia graminis f. sp. tritici CRL 75-36-700-3]|uniref:Uncharacterized protein n=1 Tax=Puccinia graminis f. sp. tritici (strain CRL 75-36-700-3 / race SCCL) TaxID=418459 RepID=E3L112_PUCGT|nr:uncharacterized protein PGTG_16515 [Puccinia graminis f. sp. tritici CRL 75-36-700-3]EFP90237.1 hypothetical protein PGTG_16515 [Puccinia graminis f. sp. tritici CRL 75-36-700-3]